MEPCHRHPAKLLRIVDGDTLICDVDLDFYVHSAVRVRIRGVNAPEAKAEGGPQATEYLANLLSGETFLIESYHDRHSFERWICDLFLTNGDNVADRIIAAGHGVPDAG